VLHIAMKASKIWK